MDERKKCVGLEGVWRGRGGEDERVSKGGGREESGDGGGSMLGWDVEGREKG